MASKKVVISNKQCTKSQNLMSQIYPWNWSL